MSLERLHEHRRLWRSKPVLARVYEPWFDALLAAAPRGGRVLEVGAGPGFLGRPRPRGRPDLRWVASDLHAGRGTTWPPTPAGSPWRPRAIDAILGLDVLHHLPDPAAFFREAARVLGARRSDHARRAVDHAPLVGGLPLLPPGGLPPVGRPVAARSPPREGQLRRRRGRALEDRARDAAARAGASSASRRRACVRVNAFAYLLSLGFRPGSLLPRPLVAPAMAVAATAPTRARRAPHGAAGRAPLDLAKTGPPDLQCFRA